MSVFFRNLPKIELHVHLDCSLSYDAVRYFEPGITKAEFLDRFVAPANAVGLPDYLERAFEGIRLMQTAENLRFVVHDLFDQFRRDHIIYAEIRFAPFEHTQQGLTPYQVVEAVASATEEAVAETGIEGRLILCTLRHYSSEQSIATVELAHSFRNRRVAGFDIAADEAAHPLEPHLPAFAYAHTHGVPCTAHAGEARGADSVWETLEKIQPQRIGHGVRSIEDPELVRVLRDKKIHLEVCPTSNIRTHVFPSLFAHSVNALYEAGLSVGINTDGRAISYVTLTEEYEKLHQTFGWGAAHFLKCNLAAVEAAFIPEELKQSLKESLQKGYPKI